MDQSENETKSEKNAEETVNPQKETWEKPAIVSFEPIRSAETLRGVQLGDGINNASWDRLLYSFHRFGGLTVASTLRIPGLLLAAPSSDLAFDVLVTHTDGRPPVPDSVVFRWPGRYGLTLSAAGSDWVFSTAHGSVFIVRGDGKEVRVYWNNSGCHLHVWDVFVRRVLAAYRADLWTQSHSFVGSRQRRGAVVLLGSSHAGKSTLAAASIQWADSTPLSDDVSILSTTGSAAVCPAATGLCLWPDSRKALGLPNDQCRPMPGYEDGDSKGKVWFEPKRAATPINRPLNAFVTLLRSPDSHTASLERIEPAEATLLAFRQSIRLNPSTITPANTTYELQEIAGLMTNVPSYRLRYSAEYCGLHSAVDSLRSLF